MTSQVSQIELPNYINIGNLKSHCFRLTVHQEFLVGFYRISNLSPHLNIIFQNLLSGTVSQVELNITGNFTSKQNERFLCIQSDDKFTFISMQNPQLITSLDLGSLVKDTHLAKQDFEYTFNSHSLYVTTPQHLIVVTNYQHSATLKDSTACLSLPANLKLTEKPIFISAMTGKNLLVVSNDFVYLTLFDLEKRDIVVRASCQLPKKSGRVVDIKAYDLSLLIQMEECSYLWNFENLQTSTILPVATPLAGASLFTGIDHLFTFTLHASGTVQMYSTQTGKMLWKVTHSLTDLAKGPNMKEHDSYGRPNGAIIRRGSWLIFSAGNSIFFLNINQTSVGEDVCNWVFPKMHPVFIGSRESTIFTVLGTLQDLDTPYSLLENSASYSQDSRLVLSPDIKVDNSLESLNQFLTKWKNIFSTIDRIVANPKEFSNTTHKLMWLVHRVQNLDIQLPLALTKGLLNTGEQFISQLQGYIEKGTIARTVHSPRLRRPIQLKNAVMLTRIYEIEKFIDEELNSFEFTALERNEFKDFTMAFQHILFTPPIQDPISDLKANAMWLNNFGRQTAVEIGKLVDALSTTLKPLQDLQTQSLSSVLDFPNTGFVTKFQFEDFLSVFGPFEDCLENLVGIVCRPWYHGWVSTRESELLLQREKPGTFLVHFADYSIGSLAITFKNSDEEIKHMPIYASLDRAGKIGYFVSGSQRFSSLNSLIESQTTLFQSPFKGELTKKPWYWGDLSSAEILPLIANEPPGTFCIRFAGSGQYALSFVNSERLVGHSLVIETPDLVLQGFEGQFFKGLDEMIDVLMKNVIISKPLPIKDKDLLRLQIKDEAARTETLKREIMTHRNAMQKIRTASVEANKFVKHFSERIINLQLESHTEQSAPQDLETVLLESFSYLSEQLQILVKAYPRLTTPQLFDFARIFKAGSVITDNYLLSQGYSEPDLANFLNFNLSPIVDYPPNIEPKILQVFQAIQIISVKIFSVLQHVFEIIPEMDENSQYDLVNFLLHLMDHFKIPQNRSLQLFYENNPHEEPQEEIPEQSDEPQQSPEPLYGQVQFALKKPSLSSSPSSPPKESTYAKIAPRPPLAKLSESTVSNESNYSGVGQIGTNSPQSQSRFSLAPESTYGSITKKHAEGRSPIQSKLVRQPKPIEATESTYSTIAKKPLQVPKPAQLLQPKPIEATESTYGTIAKKPQGQSSLVPSKLSRPKPIEATESTYGTIAKKPPQVQKPAQLLQPKPIEATESTYGTIAKKPQGQSSLVPSKLSPPKPAEGNYTTVAKKPENQTAPTQLKMPQLSSPRIAAINETYATVTPKGYKSSFKLREAAIQKKSTTVTTRCRSVTAKASYRVIRGVGIAWDQNAQRRDTMEDEHVFKNSYGGKENRAFFSIYDGHGGRKCVEFISETLHERLIKEKETFPMSSWPSIFKTVYPRVDNEIVSTLQEKKDRSGCTSVSIVLDNDDVSGKPTLYIANIGDSQAFLIRDNEPIVLTEEHNAASNQQEVSRIKSGGGYVFGKKVGGQLSVTRAFGDQHLKDSGVISTPACKEVQLSGKDSHLILACDGLWDILSPEDAAQIVTRQPTSQDAAEQLLKAALVKSRDNISVMVVSFESQAILAPPPVSAPPARPVERNSVRAETIFTNPKDVEFSFESYDFLPPDLPSEKNPTYSTITPKSQQNAPPSNKIIDLYATVPEKRSSTSLSPPLTPNPERRNKCIQEIISTEENYLKDLKIITEVFAGPISASGNCNELEYQSIFSGIEPLKNLSNQFLQIWRNKSSEKDESLVIAEAFSTLSDYFKMYTNYVSNFEKAVVVVENLKQKNPKFAATWKICESDPHCQGVDGLGFLIKPVQRICKYPLLLRELIAQTDHEETLNLLKKAQKSIDTVVDYVNEKKREADSLQKVIFYNNALKQGEKSIELVQATRRYIKNGPLLYQGSPHETILFNDLMIITKQKSEAPKYDILDIIDMNGCGFNVLGDSPDKKNAFIFKEYKSPKSFELAGRDAEDRASWVKAIVKARKNLQKLQFEENFGKRKSALPPELTNDPKLFSSSGGTSQIELLPSLGSPQALQSQKQPASSAQFTEIGGQRSSKRLFQFKNPFQKKKSEPDMRISNPISPVVPDSAPLITHLQSFSEDDIPDNMDDVLNQLIVDLDDFIEEF